MSYESDDSDVNTSEFDSQDEEAEYGLYAQLYFEPNPDVTVVNSTRKGLAEIHSEAYVFHKTYQKEVDERNFVNITGKSKTELTEENNIKECLLNKEINEIDTQNPSSLCSGSQDHTSTYSDHEKDNDCSPRTNCNIFDDITSALNDTNEIPENLVQKPDSFQCPSNVLEVCMTSNKKHTLPAKRSEKLSSICSESNIPGSIPLDGLYCTMVLSDEEIEEDVSNRLTILDGEVLRQKNGDKTRNNSRKRKRSGGTDSSENEEESRCDSLVCTMSKNTRIGESNKCSMVDESESDSDLFVLPPPSPKHYETIALDSSSDNELASTEKGKKRSANETKLRKNNSTQPAKRTCTGSPKNASEKSESWKKPNSTMIIEGKKKKRKRVADLKTQSKPNDVININSDTDSDSETCLTKGTDLCLNIDERLSVLVEKLTKDNTCGISRQDSISAKKHNVPKISHNINFAVDRSEPKKTKTCDNWTQEMANYYDIDVSEELEVEAVHKQQSNARTDWQIIKADYQVKRGMRYYDKKDRCTLCRQFGHKQKDCDRIPRCCLCSGTNHTARQDCPENCCFRCGGMHHIFCPDTAVSVTCNLCGYQGHREDLCPDLWRRFHLTTSGLRACTPLGPIIRPMMERFCYNCGQRGHYGHECPTKYESRSYRQVPQSIVSYSSPVLLINGSFVVNTKGTKIVNQDILKVPVRYEDIGKLIGVRGVIVKEVERLSAAHVRIDTEEGYSQVCIYGNSESQFAAKNMVEILLGRIPVEGFEDFCLHMSRISNQELTLETDGNRISPSTVSNENDSNAKYPIASSKWSINFLNKLGRKKNKVLDILKQNIRWLNNFKGEINGNIGHLKRLQKTLKQKNVHFSVICKAKKSLKRVAHFVLGQEKYGPGKYIHEHLQKHLLDVQSISSKKIPVEVCQNIAHTLEQVCDPPLEKLDEFLEYASHYQDSCLESFENLEERCHNGVGIQSKKGKTSKKLKAVKLQKRKKDQNEQGIIPKDTKTNEEQKRNELQSEKAGKKEKQIMPQKVNHKEIAERIKKKKIKKKNNKKNKKWNSKCKNQGTAKHFGEETN